MKRTAAAPDYFKLLLESLKSPVLCARWSESQWDRLIRSARAARLLGTLAARLQRAQLADRVPQRAQAHLAAALGEARYCRQMAVYESASVARALRSLNAPIVLLKGGAYIAQALDIATGRLPRDLDLMVIAARLDEAERLLLAAGWRFAPDLDAYDQHYYRAWTHELPPLRLPGHAFEVDLHHTILAPIGRLKPDTQALFDASLPVGDGALRVLCPADQVLHAAAHLFQDSDCAGRLRDLVDIDGLVREFAGRDAAFWDALCERARRHRLGRPLWYSLSLSRAWLDTPLPTEAAGRILDPFRPPALARWLVLSLASRALPPIDPDGEPTWIDRCARRLLEWRALWLRMPPWTLAYHSFHKARRALLAGWRRSRAPAA